KPRRQVCRECPVAGGEEAARRGCIMHDGKQNQEPATREQLRALARLGVKIDRPVSKQEANALLREVLGEPTSADEQYLRRWGLWQDGMTGREAAALVRKLTRKRFLGVRAWAQ